MYVSAAAIEEIEARYGRPRCLRRVVRMSAGQLEVVRYGTRAGRRHDVTLYIVDGQRVVMTSKPQYPPGAFRAPSGGIEPGEAFEAGALREAREETGLSIRLTRYLIRCEVEFCSESESIAWTTHACLAVPLTRELNPEDTHEIAEARWADFDEVTGPIRAALLASASPGLHYRAELDGLALEMIQTTTGESDIRRVG